MDTSEHFDLMERYVDICNQALLQNKERFPFKQILGAAKNAEQEKPIEVVIVDTVPLEAYVFRLKENGVTVQPHAACDNCECVRSWNTNMSYLKGVTKDPQSYIQNPAKLDWEWMYGARE